VLFIVAAVANCVMLLIVTLPAVAEAPALTDTADVVDSIVTEKALYAAADNMLELEFSTLMLADRKFLINVLISLSASAFHSSFVVVWVCLSILDCSVDSMAFTMDSVSSPDDMPDKRRALAEFTELLDVDIFPSFITKHL
jgi:hypothetical protein